MQKAKKYDWQDSNLALFGSDTEKQVKKESAESEPAWKGAGEEAGVQVWRINKFKVEHWPKEDYGDFFNGDSYIILNTYKEADSDELNHDLHFWIGKYSTQDEYGTAAYKTVELDTFLDDKPIQHREVQAHESPLFKTYFPDMMIMKGGCDTGFRRVLPQEYVTRLFFVRTTKSERGGKSREYKQIGLKRVNINEDDVFILDMGKEILQINGEACSHDERYTAAQKVGKMKGERGSSKVNICDGLGEIPARVMEMFSDKPKKEKCEAAAFDGNKMLKVSDQSGSMKMDMVAEGNAVDKSKLTSDDVFIIDTENTVFCWVGSGASIDERKNAMSYAANYLAKTPYPMKSITVVGQGKETASFNEAF